MDIILSDHAIFEMARRGISKEAVFDVINNPALVFPSRHGRVILQGKYFDPVLKKEMILRLIGIQEQEIFKVITVYKTSKFEKYWKEGSNEGNI